LGRRTLEPSALSGLRRLASFLEENQGWLVIDADTHVTDLAGLTAAAHSPSEAA
jgi:hypothetical protein